MKTRFARVADALEAFAEAVRALDEEVAPDWIDQSRSLLGRRRHCAAVRRRIAAGVDGAAVGVGRRYLLSEEAHAEELTKVGTSTAAPKRDIAAELSRELRFVQGDDR